jgi:DNA-binding response OmpR family regulator
VRILLIDDTPEIAELLTFALRDRGFEVVSGGYGDDVVALIESHHPHALVVDCTMLKMSVSIFDAVRERQALADFPVVLVSDTPEKADVELNAREARRVLLIPKPFTASQIARALDELLGTGSTSSEPALRTSSA